MNTPSEIAHSTPTEIITYVESLTEIYYDTDECCDEFYSHFNKKNMKNVLGLYIVSIQYDLKKLIELGKIMREKINKRFMLWIVELVYENINQASSFILSDEKFFYN